MPWSLGHVGHFGLAVPDPRASADWWVRNLGLKIAFEFEDALAIENDAITIVFHRGTANPEVLDHLSFHLRSMDDLREALSDLKRRGVDIEDPGDEIGPEAPGSANMGYGFTIPTATAGNYRSRPEAEAAAVASSDAFASSRMQSTGTFA